MSYQISASNNGKPLTKQQKEDFISLLNEIQEQEIAQREQESKED